MTAEFIAGMRGDMVIPSEAALQRMRRAGTLGQQQAGRARLAYRPSRNGLPGVNYAWRARAYPWAQRALAAAEAEHGAPPVTPGRRPGRPRSDGRCGRCGYLLARCACEATR